MATLISIADGNLTGSTTFAAVETGALALVLNRNTLTSVGAASSVTSVTFTVTNTKVIDAVLLWIRNGGGVSTGTFKVDLQKGGVSQASVTVNKADLPDSTNLSGSVPTLFKLSSTATGDGGSNWTIVLTTTGTGTGVSFHAASATVTNFTRALRTTTTATPAAADDLYVVGELTGAGTHNSRVVTMNSTATTAYGNGSVNSTTVAGGGIHISCYGTLTYGTTVGTNYVLRVNGDVIVYQFGTLTIGSSQATATGAEATAFLARTSGLDATHTNAYAALIDGLVADGIWSKFDLLHVYATQDSTTAQLNLVSSSYPATLHGSPAFTANRGYTGVDGSGTVYIDTSFNPFTASTPKFVLASCHLSTWNVTNPGNSANATIGSFASGVANTYIIPRYTDNTAYFRLNDSGSTSVAVADPVGHYVASNTSTSGTTLRGYKNASVVMGSGNGSATLINANIYTLAANVNGSAVGNPEQLAMASIGSGLSSTDVTNFYNRLNTYMTSLNGIAGTEAAAFLARTSGLDFVHVNAYTALINGLVADGIWSKLDVLHIYATQDSTTAKLNLVSSNYTATTPGATFTADRGYTGADGSSTAYVDTNFNPVTASSPKYVTTSCHISTWEVTNVASIYATMGSVSTGVAFCQIVNRYSGDGHAYFRLNDSGTGINVTTADPVGHFIANNSTGTAAQGYKNGSSIVTGSDTSNTIPNQNYYTVGSNSNGTGFGHSGQFAMASIGASLSSTDATNFYNRLRTYMTAVGVP